jgi:hypothetical protein
MVVSTSTGPIEQIGFVTPLLDGCDRRWNPPRVPADQLEIGDLAIGVENCAQHDVFLERAARAKGGYGGAIFRINRPFVTPCEMRTRCAAH